MSARTVRVVLDNRSDALRLVRTAAALSAGSWTDGPPPETAEPGSQVTAHAQDGPEGYVTYAVESPAGRLGTVTLHWTNVPGGRTASRFAVEGDEPLAFLVLPVAFRAAGCDVTDPAELAQAYATGPADGVPALPAEPPPDPTWVYELRDLLVPAREEPTFPIPVVLEVSPLRAAQLLAQFGGFQMHQLDTIVTAPELMGMVATQNPAAGTFAAPGTVVEIEMGGGPPEPDEVGPPPKIEKPDDLTPDIEKPDS